MSKNDSEYFINSDKLYTYLPDSLLTTDEWDILRNRIADELRYIDYEEVDQYYLSRGLPFLRSFELSLEDKLIEVGYKKEFIRDEIWLKGAAYTRQADYSHQDIAAALAGLLSIRKLKDILSSNGKADKNAIRIFLYSLETIINLFRAGAAPKFARQGVKHGKIQAVKRKNRITWKGLNPTERSERNKNIITAWKKTKLTLNSFAKKQSEKYGVSITQVKKIISLSK